MPVGIKIISSTAEETKVKSDIHDRRTHVRRPRLVRGSLARVVGAVGSSWHFGSVFGRALALRSCQYI
jgi:hypothetical protein